MKCTFSIPVVIFLVASTAAGIIVPISLTDGNKESPFYVGVSFNGNTTTEAKLLIDRVENYTNLFVFQSWPLGRNQSATYEVCDYAVSKGLSIIVNLGTRQDTRIEANNITWTWQLQLYQNAQSRWGDKFLGAYYDDEPGGAQIDYDWSTFYENRLNYSLPPNTTSWGRDVFMKWLAWKVNGTTPTDYNAETQVFLNYFTNNRSAFQQLKRDGIKTFVSDYALHWFDFVGGYDVVLAQFGANNSYVQAIGQVRGAARLQNREWGAIITWKYNQTPYLDKGEEIYKEMITAYEAGAKYVIIFDYPQMQGNPYGVMQDEHFEALEDFSRYVMTASNMRTMEDNNEASAAYVLPNNYGFGLRRENDRIWGYWGPDDKTAQVWNNLEKLTARFGVNLDIVYEDAAFPTAGKYTYTFYWNDTL